MYIVDATQNIIVTTTMDSSLNMITANEIKTLRIIFSLCLYPSKVLFCIVEEVRRANGENYNETLQIEVIKYFPPLLR